MTMRVLSPPFADLLNDRDVGEEVMVLCGRHRFPQSFTALEVTYQDSQAVQVGMLRGHDFKDGLSNDHTCPNKNAYVRYTRILALIPKKGQNHHVILLLFEA